VAIKAREIMAGKRLSIAFRADGKTSLLYEQLALKFSLKLVNTERELKQHPKAGDDSL